MQDEFMTIGEAADELGVTRTTIWRRVKNGALEVFQSQADQRERLVRRADIEALKRPVSIDLGKNYPLKTWRPERVGSASHQFQLVRAISL